jgi:two-component system phosphate regulon response regulator PhoB
MPAVLVVEDEPAIAELIAVNLRHNGFRPTWAMDSASAQREIDAAVPDLILLDWMLPGESGLSLAK